MRDSPSRLKRIATYGARMRAIRLDCQDLATALVSLAALLDSSVQALTEALVTYDESRFDGTQDPERQMPREVLANLGRDIKSVRPAGACYFHGTRAIDPQAFLREGLLPLNQVLDRIWAVLGGVSSRTPVPPINGTSFAAALRSTVVGDTGESSTA
jgi:hypothetical protein